MEATNPEVLQRIPHRPPFLFIDRVVERSEDGMVAEKTWDPGMSFYEGHYPGNPITPGVLLCESIFQTGAVFLAEMLEKEGKTLADATPVLSRIENAKFKAMVKPGDTVRLKVTMKEKVSMFYFLSGRIENEAGKAVATLNFALAMVKEEG